jgi:WD40 repeat protein
MVRLWDLTTGQPLSVLGPHAAPVNSLAFSPDGRTLVAGSLDEIKFWGPGPVVSSEEPPEANRATESLPVTHDLSGLDPAIVVRVNRLVFTDRGSLISADTRTGQVTEVDVEQLRILASFKGVPLPGPKPFLAFGPPDFGRLTWGDGLSLRHWELGSRSLQVWTADAKQFKALRKPGADIRMITGNSKMFVGPVAYSPTGERFATAGTDVIDIWQTDKGTHVKTLTGPRETTHLVFSPDGRFLAATGNDSTTQLWDATSLELVRSLGGHSGRVTRADFSSDGHWLFTVGHDKTLRAWDTETGQHEIIEASEFFHVCSSPAGDWLAALNATHVVVWQMGSWKKLVTLPLRQRVAICYSLAGSPDGRWLAAAVSPSGLIVWDMNGAPPDQVASALVQQFRPGQILNYMGLPANATKGWQLGARVQIGQQTFTIKEIQPTSERVSFDMVGLEERPAQSYPTGSTVKYLGLR